MQYVILALMLCWTRRACRCIRQKPCVYRRHAGALASLIYIAMALQEGALYFSGQLTWGTGLPLHLCGLLGVLTLPTLLGRSRILHSAALFVGVPGAALALLFPAVVQTPWPRLTAAAFHTLHAGLICAPWLVMAHGWRPRPADAAQAVLFLPGAATLAMLLNPVTGGNYLFLTRPVSGTPLSLLGRWGLWPYRGLLALLAGGVLAMEALLVGLLCRQ